MSKPKSDLQVTGLLNPSQQCLLSYRPYIIHSPNWVSLMDSQIKIST